MSRGERRSLRERFSLKQADLAGLLRVGANTISRWESGRNVQTASMDVLLRLFRDVPGSLVYLRNHAASEGPPPPTAPEACRRCAARPPRECALRR
jgi:transcriptional regulator with XRE-family HTH domain